ncbi:MAG: helix-turn-helix domain-containing protein, partial [Peptostreptococcaceae bacterium]|nr:helix-turn-helix domain-containing protein [Peptostreptococcaceae bacterium]
MFKERLKNLRNKYTLTQEDLAKETNISEEKIVSYELGESKPDINTLLIFANYFEVSLDFILGRSLEKYEDNDKELVGIDFFVNAFKLQKVKRIILRLCLLIPIVNFFYIGRIVSY